MFTTANAKQQYLAAEIENMKHKMYTNSHWTRLNKQKHIQKQT